MSPFFQFPIKCWVLIKSAFDIHLSTNALFKKQSRCFAVMHLNVVSDSSFLPSVCFPSHLQVVRTTAVSESSWCPNLHEFPVAGYEEVCILGDVLGDNWIDAGRIGSSLSGIGRLLFPLKLWSEAHWEWKCNTLLGEEVGLYTEI